MNRESDPLAGSLRVSPMEWTRRAVLGGLGAAALGFAVFGPRPGDDAPRGRVVLDYWEKWTGAEGAAMQALVDRFNASQDRIWVRYLAMGSIDQKAMIAIAGGSPPDVVGLWNFNVPSYAEAGALEPLDELAASSGLDASRYAPAVWAMGEHLGRQWAMISTCGSLALYINRARLAEVGLDPDFAPTTIAELDELNHRLTERDADGRIDRVGFIHADPGWWSWIWGYQFGGALLDSATGDATAASPENVRAYEWAQSYPERYGSRELLTFQSGLGYYGTAQQPFLTGKVATMIQGPWLANLIGAFEPGLDYRAVPMPVSEDIYDPVRPVGLLDGDVLVIPRGARNPEASFEFIAWLHEREQLESLARSHGKNSPLREASAGFTDGHPNRSIAVHNELANSERAFLFPRTRAWPRYVAEFDSGFQKIWGLRDEPGEVLGDIERRAQQAIDEARANLVARGKAAES